MKLRRTALRFVIVLSAGVVGGGALVVVPSWAPVVSRSFSFGLSAQPPPQRIVSLVPAVTEMLFAMGAGPRVVGVSSFDRRPPEATRLPKVGGLLNPDVEAILALRPDLVIVYGTQVNLKSQLERARVSMFLYSHGGLSDITATLHQLGARLGLEERARASASDLDAKLAQTRNRVVGVQRPRTLVVFGREPGSLRNVYASGGIGFIHDMLGLAGGENVFADIKRESVQATSEMILARAPEVIVELHPNSFPEDAQVHEREVWKRLASVPAVRTDRVFLLIGDEFVVPGPRIGDATEKLARVLHPERF